MSFLLDLRGLNLQAVSYKDADTSFEISSSFPLLLYRTPKRYKKIYSNSEFHQYSNCFSRKPKNKGRFSLRKITMGLDRIGTKSNPCMSSGTNFLFQFEPVIRNNPDDKELKYFQLFWSGGADTTRWKKVIRSLIS